MLAGGQQTTLTNVEEIRFLGDSQASDDDQSVVFGANSPPIAHDLTFAATEDTVLRLAPGGLTAGASDPDGGAVQLVDVKDAVNGSVAVDSHGFVVFTPDEDFFGDASFIYKVRDASGLMAEATARRDYDAVLFVVETMTIGAMYYGPHRPVPDVHPLRATTNTFPPHMVPVFIYSTLARGVINGRRVGIAGDSVLRRARWLLGQFRADPPARQVIACFSSVIDRNSERKSDDEEPRLVGSAKCVELAQSVGIVPAYDDFVHEQISRLDQAKEPVDCEVPSAPWYQRTTQ
jgi:hypothetical protein